MAIFAEANNRLYNGVFVCLRCKSKQRAPILKVLAGKISCRKCKSHAFRPVRRK